MNDFHDSTGVSKLQRATTSDVEIWIEQLKDRIQPAPLNNTPMPDYLTENTVVGMVSRFNTVLHHIGRDDLIKTPSEWGFKRSTDFSNKANPPEAAAAMRNILKTEANNGNLFSASLLQAVELMRAFGLRYREAVAIKLDHKDPGAAYLEMEKQDQTKCHKYRRIEITTESQRETLQSAKNFAKSNAMRSLIPNDMTLNQSQDAAYRKAQAVRDATGLKYHFHGERHAYAHQKYTALWQERTGYPIACPAALGLGGRKLRGEWQRQAIATTGLSKSRLLEMDKQIRLKVSEDLGHGRVDVTLTYLG